MGQDALLTAVVPGKGSSDKCDRLHPSDICLTDGGKEVTLGDRIECHLVLGFSSRIDSNLFRILHYFPSPCSDKIYKVVS